MPLDSLIHTCLGDRDPLALARTHAAHLEPWLTPISPQAPSGSDPRHQEDFQALREAVDKLSGVDASRVGQLAERLLHDHCKDLRVAGYYLWARLHASGEAGLAEGVGLVAALLERFGAEVLPTRPAARKAALQWLASERVLNSLALHPQVTREHSERCVAALAWLAQCVADWPEADRPEWGALYRALAERLAQVGGLDVPVPQHAAVGVPTAPVLQSGRDLLDSGKALAMYLREQPQGWLAAHRLMRSLRWDTLHRAPERDLSGNTRLAAPRSDYRAQLQRLHAQQAWEALLEQAERMFAEAVNHVWLDLHWYLCEALRGLGKPWASWIPLLEADLHGLLQRLPGLEQLHYKDGWPFAEPECRAWIDQRSVPAGVPQPVAGFAPDLEAEACARVQSDGLDPALAWLAAQSGDGRQRWQARLVMARLAERHGRMELALHLLDDLHERPPFLTDWEPALAFEAKARLLALVRQRSARTDPDRAVQASRCEALLAELVCLDPVRAAPLCR